MLHWLVESQALPSLMWLMVGQSCALLALVLYLGMAVVLLPQPVGERGCRKALVLAAELGPMTGMFGTVCGMSYCFRHLDAEDPHAFIVEGLKTSMYTTAFGLVIAMAALVVLSVFPWRR